VAAHSGARERARARATVVIIAACTSDAIDLSGLDDDDDPREGETTRLRSKLERPARTRR
jgi:hypothetical protein